MSQMNPIARSIFGRSGPILNGWPRTRPARCSLTAGFVFALILGGVVHAETATYRLDPAHTTVAFLVSHIGFARVPGSFGEVEGHFRFNEASDELTEIAVIVNTESVATMHEARDEHVRGGDFLASQDFSEMRFSADTGQRTDTDTFEITGELELLGQRHPLVLRAKVNKRGDYPMGRNVYAMGVSATGTLKRSDYGMTYALDNGWVGDEVEIIIEFEARRD